MNQTRSCRRKRRVERESLSFWFYSIHFVLCWPRGTHTHANHRHTHTMHMHHTQRHTHTMYTKLIVVILSFSTIIRIHEVRSKKVNVTM